MHGMLSAAVMLAAFAVTALAGAASVVWLCRVAAARPRPAQARRTAGAAGRDDPGVMAATRLADDGAGFVAVAWPGKPAGPGTAEAPEEAVTAARPDPGWDDAGDVPGWDDAGDVPGWPGPGHMPGWPGPGGGPGPGDDRGSGREPDAPDPCLWPDQRRSLYSRGWPAMDSPPHAEAAGSPDPEPGGREPAPGDPAPAAAAAEAPADGPGGARVYVLGEARRRGR